MDVTRRVAANVKRLRKAQKLTQEELAFRAGIDRSYISQIERGVKNPTIVMLDKVATGLALPLADLVS